MKKNKKNKTLTGLTIAHGVADGGPSGGGACTRTENRNDKIVVDFNETLSSADLRFAGFWFCPQNGRQEHRHQGLNCYVNITSKSNTHTCIIRKTDAHYITTLAFVNDGVQQ